MRNRSPSGLSLRNTARGPEAISLKAMPQFRRLNRHDVDGRTRTVQLTGQQRSNVLQRRFNLVAECEGGFQNWLSLHDCGFAEGAEECEPRLRLRYGRLIVDEKTVTLL